MADEATHIDEVVESLEAAPVLLGNLRRIVRTGTGRQSKADARGRISLTAFSCSLLALSLER